MKRVEIDEWYEALGKRVAQARQKARMTQSELAELTGVRRTTITNIETGRTQSPAHRLVEIADELGMQTADLLPPHEPPALNERQKASLENVESEDEIRQTLRILHAKLRANAGDRYA